MPPDAGFRLDAESKDGNIDVGDFSVSVDNGAAMPQRRALSAKAAQISACARPRHHPDSQAVGSDARFLRMNIIL